MTTTRAPHVRGVLAAALFVLVTLLAGCGDDDGTAATDPGSEPTASDTASATASESPTEEPTESESPKAPQCADVWVDGAKLPGGYQDCYEGDVRVKADGRYCEFGKMLVTYDNHFWAVPAGPISEVDGKLLDDAGYRDALHKCSG